MNPDLEPENFRKRIKSLALIGGIVIVVLWGVSGFAIYCLFPANERATVGEIFGAINALFSGLAFLGVITTIFMQSKELEYQRQELKHSISAQRASAEALEKQWMINRFSAELNAINNMIDYYNREIDNLSKGLLNTNTQSSLTSLKREKDKLVQDLKNVFSKYEEGKEAIWTTQR